MKALKVSLLCTVISCLCAGIWLIFDFHHYVNRPADANDLETTFVIRAGDTFDELAIRLKTAGIITDRVRFKLYSRIKGYDKQLKTGEYRLSGTMTPIQILDTLVQGKSVLYRLTIPEGYTLNQIADEAERQNLGQKDDFLKLAKDPAVAKSFSFEAQTLEGYLFPDTYYFPKDVASETIIATMVTHFKSQFQAHWYQRAKELKLSVHQIVTLASIIEKETGASSERSIIASVFHNRLKKKMRLESDPTVIYGIPDFDGNIKRHHLRQATPYNSYRIKGLPPGPIANPGSAAIEAALYPDQTDYLYFVAKKDGTHYFSKNIKEHNRAVRKYQLRRRRKPSS